MNKAIWAECPTCLHRETLDRVWLACPACGGEWLDARYEYRSLAHQWRERIATRPFSLWRYWDLLPLREERNILTIGEGGTPLLHGTNLGMMLGRPHIYVKDERQGPTGSFKDRQAALAISVMKEQGITEAVVASTGNVAISYSAYSALAGIKLWAFLTSSVPADKMREVALYGSEVIKVTGTYDQTKEVAADFAERKGLHLDRGLKSFAAKESMKTVAFEIAEQLGWRLDGGGAAQGAASIYPPIEGSQLPRFRAPDWYVQAVSGGLGPIGVWKGFQELREMGLIDRMPKLACIQASGCAPMVNSFQKGLEVAEPVHNPQTLITTVATGSPGLAYTYLRKVILEHGGVFEAATDEEAFRAMHVMAKMDGISMEPAAGLAFAGLFKMVSAGVVKPQDVVVVNCSGHTFPVEKHLLDDAWAQSLDAVHGERAGPTEEGLLTSLDRLDTRVQRVVIIEDDGDARRLLRRILQARGDYQVFEAEGGSQGIDLVRQVQPDLVLLDLMMPDVDGFEVLETIRADEELADTRIIVITAKSLTAGERRRLTGQIELLLQKGSFMDDDLLEDILETLK
ncbi:MAG: pyridoxal-phosphate dependent enzyme [Anaerolineae bacterium]|jgi:threonine synthase